MNYFLSLCTFRKNLESALRFGNSLLVQDVESYDPILNPVLNKERTGGRVLITIGDQDIDLSPAFQIFLITRDASVEFSPDVCSRVTFVNFTVTSSSLASQCLNQVLRSERPDVDKKRSDLLKLQGEFAVRLRQLEKALLAALNESKGKILDDNSVIGTLEKLKTEASEVAKKAAETDKVMAEVEAVSAQYQRLAAACSQIYHTLQQLNEV
uniref:AAA_9 domain-containing protein n=1 Tax=Heterorhabditis bacteriophora TaxID=37862 RepID=A0A1I7XQH0_HETBA